MRLLLALISLQCLVACSDRAKLPELPLLFPFDTQQSGFKIETDLRMADYDSFRIAFNFGFKEGDAADRKRVRKLAGDQGRDKDGKLIEPGVSVALRIRINALKPSTLEGFFEKEFLEEQMIGFSATDYHKKITNVRLRRGTYHVVVENLETVPELQGTPVTLYMASDSKSTFISD